MYGVLARRGLLAIALLFLPSLAYARGGAPISYTTCPTSSPTQAHSYNLDHLVKCDTFTNNLEVDLNNSQVPGFNWYTTVISGEVMPASNIVSTGTYTTLLGTPDNGFKGEALSIRGNTTAPPYTAGVPVVGSFYAEMDMAFNPVTPPGNVTGNSPAFWLSEAYAKVNGVIQPSHFPFVEVDIMECLPNTPGLNCVPNFQFHIWRDVGGAFYDQCSSNGAYSTSGINFNNFNTYGLLFIASTDNAGTGILNYYINNVATVQCTYTSTDITCNNFGLASPGCTTSKADGDMLSMDVQNIAFTIGAGVKPWPENIRNFHVWQK